MNFISISIVLFLASFSVSALSATIEDYKCQASVQTFQQVDDDVGVLKKDLVIRGGEPASMTVKLDEVFFEASFDFTYDVLLLRVKGSDSEGVLSTEVFTFLPSQKKEPFKSKPSIILTGAGKKVILSCSYALDQK